MDRGQAIAFYATISCVAFVVSKIFIALLLYKRWKRRHVIYEDGISGIIDSKLEKQKLLENRCLIG